MTTKPTITQADRDAVAAWLKASGRTTYIIEAAEHFAAALREERERLAKSEEACLEWKNAMNDNADIIEDQALDLEALRDRNAELERAVGKLRQWVDLHSRCTECGSDDWTAILGDSEGTGHCNSCHADFDAYMSGSVKTLLASTAHLVNEKETK